MATCPTCAPRQKLKTLNPVLQPILAHKPWSYVGIDLVGPLAETPRGNKHILTATDLFSKWTEAVPIPDATSRIKPVLSGPTPVVSPTPVPVVSPVSRPTPVPVVSPVSRPTPVPVVSPVSRPTPVPVVSPVSRPTPVPVVSPVSRPTPVPVVSPVSRPTPAPDADLTAQYVQRMSMYSAPAVDPSEPRWNRWSSAASAMSGITTSVRG